MMTNLYGFLAEAANQRDPEDIAQGIITVYADGLIGMFGYVERVTPDLLSLERIKTVHNLERGHLSLDPYLYHFALSKISMARYADLKEVRR